MTAGCRSGPRCGIGAVMVRPDRVNRRIVERRHEAWKAEGGVGQRVNSPWNPQFMASGEPGRSHSHHDNPRNCLGPPGRAQSRAGCVGAEGV